MTDPEDDPEDDRAEWDRHIARHYPRLWATLVAGRRAERADVKMRRNASAPPTGGTVRKPSGDW